MTHRTTGMIKIGSLALLLVGTAVLYLWGLTASGYANSFYAAAAQAGAQDWVAFLYGSLDPANSITVDKPPASLWLMALSVRLFGLSPASILVPQALLGVATVGLLYATVRRTSGHGAGLVAGALLALTPVATLMFRFNNPDALLVFLLTLAAYATLRAVGRGTGRWLVLAGVIMGFAFLTKMLQAFLVLPAFILVYLLMAPIRFRTRLFHLLAACAAMIVSLGWWVALVELVPGRLRPYIGGSQHDSVLELIFGYNGLGRITGREVGSVGGGPGGGWGETGPTRLFDSVSGGMISWLIPAALVLAVVALIALAGAERRRESGSDPGPASPRIVAAAILIFVGWLLVTALVFSFMAGIYHDYYTVALAPAVAATVAIAAAELWRQRARWLSRIGLAVAAVATTAWAVVLLGRATEPYPQLRVPLAVVGALAAFGLLLVDRTPRVVGRAITGTALAAGLVGPLTFSLHTAAEAHQGSIVTAGPIEGGPAGRRIWYGAEPPGDAGPPPPNGQRPHGPQPNGERPRLVVIGGPVGGLLGGDRASDAVVDLLRRNSDGYTWAAATTGSQGAATYQLASGLAVMPIGGFNGSDPSPTLAEFQQLVAEGRIRYYLDSAGPDLGELPGGPQQNGGSFAAQEIADWVRETFPSTTVDDVVLYDLSRGR